MAASGLTLPKAPLHAISRSRLLARIDGSGADTVSVVAGPGYGKTTLLRAWVEHDPRPSAWVTLDDRDNDPAVLLADLAVALDRVDPSVREALMRLAKSSSQAPANRVRQLMRSLDGLSEPAIIVLDDLHLAGNHKALDTISALVERAPHGWAVALASREVPDLPLPRLRATDRLLELSDRDLAMDDHETAQLVRAAGLDLPDEAITLIQRRTEGWAIAIQLAIASIREKDDPIEAVSSFGGDDRLISEYVRDELLRSLPKRQLRFMRRTAILHQLTPALCDAVVGSKGSASLLAQLDRTNSLVVPFSEGAGGFRYHQLLREVLLAELHRTEPDLVPKLNRRAASWSEANGLPDEAIAYSQAAFDVQGAARLVCSVTRRYLSLGRLQTLERWLSWFDEDALIKYPPLAVTTAWGHAFIGDEDPVRWLRIAEDISFDGAMPDGSSSYEAAVALLRAALCPDGPQEMVADVARAAEMGRASNEWRVFHHLLAGEAALLVGETERARALFHEAAEVGGPAQAGGHVMALSELAAMSANAGEWDEADRWIGRAQKVAIAYGLGDILLQPLMFAVSALVLARQGKPDLARRALMEAQRLRMNSPFAIPSSSIRGRIMMARAYLALSDVEGARTIVAEARDFQARRPDIGTLADDLNEVENATHQLHGPGKSGPASLSVAELRVLALLPTHLSFRRIGERLFVSNNTVKTQAMSIYRKLGVSSRAEAVERAGALGLLDL